MISPLFEITTEGEDVMAAHIETGTMAPPLPYKSYTLDHLGVMAGMCDELGIAEPGCHLIAVRFGRAVRGHWSIENPLHWSLDVTLHEDACRVRQGEAAENFAVLRPIALSLLRQEKTASVGLKAKRFKAALNIDYLLKVMNTQM
jgi:hypothetical protein